MRTFSLFPSSVALWVCIASCSSKPLQDDAGPTGGGGIILDGGNAGNGGPGGDGNTGGSIGGSGGGRIGGTGGSVGGGGGSIGGTGGSGGGGATTGRRSYVVTSMFQRDGGLGPAPTSHTFTLVLEADRRSAIAGGAGESKALTLEQTAGGALHVLGSTTFTISAAACNNASIAYSDLSFTIDANDRLTGAGSGTLNVLQGDTVLNVGASATLTGVPDTQAPTLTIAGGFGDPLLSFAVRASEPLAPSASAVLRALDGETILLPPTSGIGSVVGFQKPNTTLRYGMRYDVVVDGVADFAGNAAVGVTDLFFFTKPVPPLSAADGFESVNGTTFAGVSVLSSADGPVITGTRSLYIPATTAGTLGPPTQPELLLRLPVSPGDSNVRFSYRIVKVTNGFWFGGTWLVGREGSAPTATSSMPDTGATTDVMVAGKTWTLGPITTASLPLPAGATNEVVIQRNSPTASGFCGPPPPAAHGIIIDDMRVE